MPVLRIDDCMNHLTWMNDGSNTNKFRKVLHQICLETGLSWNSGIKGFLLRQAELAPSYLLQVHCPKTGVYSFADNGQNSQISQYIMKNMKNWEQSKIPHVKIDKTQIDSVTSVINHHFQTDIMTFKLTQLKSKITITYQKCKYSTWSSSSAVNYNN